VAEAQGAMLGAHDLVLVSGYHNNGGQTTAEVYALNVMTGTTWDRMDDLPVSDGINHGAVAVNDKVLYMCGGFTGSSGPDTDLCFVYNHTEAPGQGKQWSNLAPLPEGRAGGGLIYDKQSRSLVFASGTRKDDPAGYNTVWQYSMNNPSNGWVRKAGLPFVADHMSSVTVVDPQTGKERHFFLGGYAGHSRNVDNVEWDAVQELWIRRQSMPMTRAEASYSTRAFGCGFIIAGGTTNEHGMTGDISYYDLTTDTWTSLGELPRAIAAPVCDISGDYLYCESGWDVGYTASGFSYRRKIVVGPPSGTPITNAPTKAPIKSPTQHPINAPTSPSQCNLPKVRTLSGMDDSKICSLPLTSTLSFCSSV
jgi:hypothetical protein